jgi:endonuclease/exonuclease/phosphatase family metal-dependent hydrolase
MPFASPLIQRNSRSVSLVSSLRAFAGADIVGLQEVDNRTTRSGSVDQTAELARMCGYPYYAYGKQFDFQVCDECACSGTYLP